MAQIIKLVDDLDKTSEATQTLRFAVQSEETGNLVEIEIDLNDSNYDRYNEILTLLAANGREVVREPVKVKRTLSAGKKTGVKGKTQEMREWLRANGHSVSDRGRVPTHLVDLYETRPRGPQKVLGEDDMREVVKNLKGDEKEDGGESGTAGKPDVQDEDTKLEQAVIERVKAAPKARRTPAQKKTAESNKPTTGLRKALSLVDGE